MSQTLNYLRDASSFGCWFQASKPSHVLVPSEDTFYSYFSFLNVEWLCHPDCSPGLLDRMNRRWHNVAYTHCCHSHATQPWWWEWPLGISGYQWRGQDTAPLCFSGVTSSTHTDIPSTWSRMGMLWPCWSFCTCHSVPVHRHPRWVGGCGWTDAARMISSSCLPLPLSSSLNPFLRAK